MPSHWGGGDGYDGGTAQGDQGGGMCADAGPSDARWEYIVRGSHRSLVPALADHPSPATPDIPTADGLVVAPLPRHDPLLETPARLAADLGWPLLLLCSRGNQAQRARHL